MATVSSVSLSGHAQAADGRFCVVCKRNSPKTIFSCRYKVHERNVDTLREHFCINLEFGELCDRCYRLWYKQKRQKSKAEGKKGSESVPAKKTKKSKSSARDEASGAYRRNSDSSSDVASSFDDDSDMVAKPVSKSRKRNAFEMDDEDQYDEANDTTSQDDIERTEYTRKSVGQPQKKKKKFQDVKVLEDSDDDGFSQISEDEPNEKDDDATNSSDCAEEDNLSTFFQRKMFWLTSSQRRISKRKAAPIRSAKKTTSLTKLFTPAIYSFV